MARTYLNTAPSESGKDEHGVQIGMKALITGITAVSGDPRGVRAAVRRDLEAKVPTVDNSLRSSSTRDFFPFAFLLGAYTFSL
jgi:hypothetical protein